MNNDKNYSTKLWQFAREMREAEERRARAELSSRNGVLFILLSVVLYFASGAPLEVVKMLYVITTPLAWILAIGIPCLILIGVILLFDLKINAADKAWKALHNNQKYDSFGDKRLKPWFKDFLEHMLEHEEALELSSQANNHWDPNHRRRFSDCRRRAYDHVEERLSNSFAGSYADLLPEGYGQVVDLTVDCESSKHKFYRGALFHIIDRIWIETQNLEDNERVAQRNAAQERLEELFEESFRHG